MVKSIYSSQKDTPKEYDANNSFLSNSMDNSLNNINKNSNKFKKNEEIMIIESNTNDFGELNTEHNNYNNLITKKSKNIKDNKMSGNSGVDFNFFINNNNNIYRNHLQTVLETLNEVSNSIVESSAINKNSQIDLNNVDDAKEVNDVGEKKIFNNEQKYQFSENRINYTDNNIGSNIPTTSVVHNTKKSIYVTKSEKAD